MNAQTWNELVQKYQPSFGGFLQSWSWGEFQESLGFAVRRIYEETPSGVVIAQAVHQPLKLGLSYWLVPKGPLGTANEHDTLAVLRRELPGAFLKLEPVGGFRAGKRVDDRHPSATTVVDLTQGEEAMFASMKPKTRYNVRLAEKKGVTVSYAGAERFSDFIALMEMTAKRDGFHLHSRDRYQKMLAALQTEDCCAFLALADLNGVPLAANMMIDSFGVRTYLHGASSNEARNVMAPYILHAELMRDAIAKGMYAYDFWGIAPPGSSEDHPWAGITRFKMGFGGDVRVTVGTVDVPVSPLRYTIYRGLRRLR